MTTMLGERQERGDLFKEEDDDNEECSLTAASNKE
jgi:hypothetical protein